MNEAPATHGHIPLDLLFLNPILRPDGGPMVTVRKGTKWLGTDGREIIIRRTGDEGNEIARGRIISTDVYALQAIPEDLLLEEHDDLCRTLLGLGIAMGQAYPDIKPTDDVTIVTFTVS